MCIGSEHAEDEEKETELQQAAEQSQETAATENEGLVEATPRPDFVFGTGLV